MDAVEVRGESGAGGLDGIASGAFSQQPELQPSTPAGGCSVKVRLAPYYDCNPQGLDSLPRTYAVLARRTVVLPEGWSL